MPTLEKESGVLNDLIEINNDRVAGFEKAIADIKDENIDLKKIFQGYAEQSRKNGQELSALVGSVSKVETGFFVLEIFGCSKRIMRPVIDNLLNDK